MNVHQNARLTPLGRERLVGMIECGATFASAARTCGCSPKTAARWWRRFECEGLGGLQDRTSRPHSLRSPTPVTVKDRIIGLRRQRLSGAHIATKMGVSTATVSRVLRRAGLSRLRDLKPAGPVRRYEREHPGDMIHQEIKRLGKFERAGHRRPHRTVQPPEGQSRWEYVHVCIDDASRLSFTQIHPDEKATSAVVHLRAAVAWYALMGITVARVMTVNGSCYKSHAFKAANQSN